MMLLWLLVLPLGSGLVSLVISKGKFNWLELIAHTAAVSLIIVIGYYIALHGQMTDTEIWNGVVAHKEKVESQCCHKYSCDCHEVCTGNGKNKSCTTSCDTCYEHGSRTTGWDGDRTWQAYSSNNELIYDNSCNSPNTSEPSRYTGIKIGEPTAFAHKYTNYIKGNPDSIMRREGAAEEFHDKLPQYPKVYDYYHADRFIAVGVTIPDIGDLNKKLSEINGSIGAQKQINIIVVAVNETDSRYLEALREVWLGGKKNDFVVVIGVADYPNIGWAGVISWTKNEALKVDIRYKLLDMQKFDGQAILNMLQIEAYVRFERRHMSDFEYLKDTIEIPNFAFWTLLIIGIIVSAGLQIWFWREDPFNIEKKRKHR